MRRLPDRARHGLELQRRRLRLPYCGFACTVALQGLLADVLRQPGRVPERPAGPVGRVQPDLLQDARRVLATPAATSSCSPTSPRRRSRAPTRAGSTHGDGYYLSRAEVSPANDQVAIDWIRDDGAAGITDRRSTPGTVPSDLVAACDIPARRHGEQPHVLARRHADGLERRRGREGRGRAEPGRRHRHLHAHRPAHVISATGRTPSFGGADVATVAGGGRAAVTRRRRPAGAGQRRPAPREDAQGPPLRQGHARRVRQGPDAQGRRREGRAHRRLRRGRQGGRAQAAPEGRRLGGPHREPRRRGRRDGRRRPRPRDGQARRHREAPPQADQGRQARRQADAQGRADDQGQPGRRDRHGEDQAAG